jgi:hypothetical protein
VTDPSPLLQQEADAWARLGSTFARVPDGRFEEPTLTPEGWSPKDAMFHVAGWMHDCAAQLGHIAAGSFDPAEETREAIERQNQAWFERSRSMSPDDVRADFLDARRRMVEAFGAVEHVSPVAVEWFEESGALHYAKHVEDLRDFLGEDAG